MNFNEKPEFIKLIKRAASKVAKIATAEIVDGYYDYLKDYPLDLIERAINQAYRDRDPDDLWLKTQMVTSLEIEQAAKSIIEEENRSEQARCSKCGGMRWIVEERADGSIVAHPCECLYKMVTDTLKKKNTTTNKNRKYMEMIAASYEAYQRR